MKPLSRFAWIWVAGATLILGCTSPKQQRVPKPMRYGAADELPPPRTNAGDFQASLVRHADSVEIRRPGALDAFPMRFWDKTVRISAGWEIRCSAGGRAEFAWDADASSVVLSDTGSVILGDAAAGEALVTFQSVTHARMTLTPEDYVVLPGGAELRGDDQDPAGPFVLYRVSNDMVGLTNQSRLTGLLRYRDVALEIGPGESLDIPIVSSGTTPNRSTGEVQTIDRGGLRLNVQGQVQTREGERTVGVRALESATLEGLGVRVTLNAGDVATLSSMRRRTTGEEEGVSADPQAASFEPEPASDPDSNQ